MSDVLAILNCYCPQTGANMGQMVFRSDGSHEFTGAQPDRAKATMLALKRMIFPRGRQSRAIAEHFSLLPRPRPVETPRRPFVPPPQTMEPVPVRAESGPRLVDGGLGIDHLKVA